MNKNFSLGNRLRELRQERALSQEQVANNAEITPAYLGQLERGAKKNISVSTLDKICDALNISIVEFFSTSKERDNSIDEISNQILHQLNGKSESEKQAILRLIKLVFSLQDMK